MGFRRRVRAFVLTLLSLTRNPNTTQLESCMTCMDPCMKVFEKLILLIGPVCVLLVFVGVSFVVFTMYSYIVPILQNEHPILFFSEVLYGHWLLVNVVFHYYRGVTTKPGSPLPAQRIDESLLEDGWSICKKCDQPRPARAHHCRLCGFCVLKMDHHCPWLNNCVGHNNHRYFMLFIIYIWQAVLFVMCTSGNYALSLMVGSRSLAHWLLAGTPLKFVLAFFGTNPELHSRTMGEVTMVMLLFFICFGVWIGLTILGGWHLYLISKAETSIEWNDNRIISMELSRRGKKFVNPHSYGFKNNWKLFLGLVHNRNFIRHVLLPSGHPPAGNGSDWRLGHLVRAPEPVQPRHSYQTSSDNNGKVFPV